MRGRWPWHHPFIGDDGPKLNILVLHAMGDFSTGRKTSKDHALCFRRYAPTHNYVYQDVNAPVTSALRKVRFHAVILDTTALCIRYYRPHDLFLAEKERYKFLAESDAVRIAFPQDDYDHSELLDQWLADYRTDVVYSVVWSHRELLYPRMMRRGEVREALTGYVNDEDIDRTQSFAKQFTERQVDIGYRAKYLPAQFGRFGQLKGRIAEVITRAAAGRGLTLDVSTRADQVFLGDDWLRFLGNCRWCVGAEGGSSLWDPVGRIRDRVVAFAAKSPEATFEEIEAACFPGLDGRHVFSAVSPRLFEAALASCAQILVRARYLGVLQAGEHYLPLDESPDVLNDIVDEVRNPETAARMGRAAYEALIATSEFRYSQHVTRVMDKVTALVAQRHVSGSSQARFERLVQKHEEEVKGYQQGRRGDWAERDSMKITETFQR
jgi:hypothetical protein